MIGVFGVLSIISQLASGNVLQTPFDQLDGTVKKFFSEHKSDPRTWYNALEFKYRVSAACVVTKILEENSVPRTLDQIVDVSRGGMMAFSLKPSIAFESFWMTELSLQVELIDLGYTKGFGASYERRWGLRSPQTGAQLHYSMSKKFSDESVDVHIDLKNPGKITWLDRLFWPAYLRKAYTHLKGDKWQNAWTRLHTPYSLVQLVPNYCGLGATDRDQALSSE